MKNLRSKGETLRFRSRVTNITFKLDRPLGIHQIFVMVEMYIRLSGDFLKYLR